jgi:hypothetical protein
MSSLGIKDDALEAVMKNTFNIDLNQSQDKMHGKKFNKIQKVAQAIEIEKNLEGNTLWGLFNGITRYTNHMITYKGTAADNIMQGQGYNYNLKAFNTIVEWIEKNTTETVPVNI